MSMKFVCPYLYITFPPLADSTIVGYKVSLDLPSDDTPESACIKWFLQDHLINPDILSSPASPCPCNLRQAIFDSQFRFDFVSFLTNTFSTDVLCFVSRFPNSGVYQRLGLSK